MSKKIVTKMSPEGLEIANSYLEHGTMAAAAANLGITEDTVVRL